MDMAAAAVGRVMSRLQKEIATGSLAQRAHGGLSAIIAALASIYIVFQFFEHDLSFNSYYLLALVGLAAVLTGRAIPFSRHRAALFLLFAFGAFIALAVLSTWLNGSPEGGWADIERRFAKLLLVVPIYFALDLAQADERWLWNLSLAGCFACGTAALVHLFIPEVTQLLPIDEFILGKHAGRVYANSNPIDFGSVSLIHTAMLAVAYRYFLCRGTCALILWAAGVCGGVLAVILSGSRGVWLAIPVLLAIGVWRTTTDWTLKARAALVGLLAACLLASWHIPLIKERAYAAANDLARYADPDEDLASSSLGLRLEMWRTAWGAFRENPVLGVGQGGYRVQAERAIDSGEASPAIRRFDHPHNQYLSSLASMGIPGLIAFVLCLGVPGRYLWIQMHGPDESKARLGLAGLLMICAYAVFALTEANFESRIQTALYAFSLALLYAALNAQRLVHPSGRLQDTARV